MKNSYFGKVAHAEPKKQKPLNDRQVEEAAMAFSGQLTDERQQAVKTNGYSDKEISNRIGKWIHN